MCEWIIQILRNRIRRGEGGRYDIVTTLMQLRGGSSYGKFNLIFFLSCKLLINKISTETFFKEIKVKLFKVFLNVS